MIFRYSLMTSVGLSAERGQGPTVLEAAKMAFEIGLEGDILASSVTLSIKGSFNYDNQEGDKIGLEVVFEKEFKSDNSDDSSDNKGSGKVKKPETERESSTSTILNYNGGLPSRYKITNEAKAAFVFIGIPTAFLGGVGMKHNQLRNNMN